MVMGRTKHPRGGGGDSQAIDFQCSVSASLQGNHDDLAFSSSNNSFPVPFLVQIEEALAVSSTTPTLCTSEIKRRRSGSTPVCLSSAPGPLHLPPNLVSVGNWNDPGGHQ
ncbi:uncharacterized protein LOC135615935 isoform X1 [Musa acuminata AAA Group]|uniref:uncharacterized protein LOC135615935 isoform X1 n=1 Tax=Musa acuminata AAA Group TaxID=214697 RepID=UPI0031E06BAA